MSAPRLTGMRRLAREYVDEYLARPPVKCSWCSGPVVKPRRTFCSGECSRAWHAHQVALGYQDVETFTECATCGGGASSRTRSA